MKNRGGLGVQTVRLSEKSGYLTGLVATDGSEDIMIMTDTGVVIRFDINDISQTSRVTLGVRMIRLDEGAKVSSLTAISSVEDEDESQQDDE